MEFDTIIRLRTTDDQNLIEDFINEVCNGMSKIFTNDSFQATCKYVKNVGIWAEDFLKIVQHLNTKGYLIPQIIINVLDIINIDAMHNEKALCVLGLCNLCNNSCALCKRNKIFMDKIKLTSTWYWNQRDIEYRQPITSIKVLPLANIEPNKKNLLWSKLFKHSKWV